MLPQQLPRPYYYHFWCRIKPKDITSCEDNAILLRKIRDGDPSLKRLYVVNEEDEVDDGIVEKFRVAEGDDLGWLGYFIGKSEVIKFLHINCDFPEGGEIYFFDGMSQNRSIKILQIYSEIGDSWNSLGSFLRNNDNLSQFEVRNFVVGHEDAQNLVTALRLQSQLKNLRLSDNIFGRDGCIALGNTLSRWHPSNKLEILDLSYNSIHNEGLQALGSGIMNCLSLKRLNLSGNQSITADGLRSLYPLLQSESHSLEGLHLYGTNFGDDAAIALSEILRGNRFLKDLSFDVDVETAGITAVGWSAFSALLCETSTVNGTYLSNHTLTRLGNYDYKGTPKDIQRLLKTNKYQNRQVAAICKILWGHPDLDMEPFYKLKMQFLPSVISWFERVEPIEEQPIEDELIGESQRCCQSRKLSALYKFVRAMPDLTIIEYWEGRMIYIEAETRRIADERRRLDDIEHRSKYEKKVTLERLGDRPMDESEVNRNKRMRYE